MLLPNKTIPYSDSVIARFSLVLDKLSSGEKNINNIYKSNKKKYGNIQNFVDTLDCLFAIGKIEIDENTEEIKLCSTN